MQFSNYPEFKARQDICEVGKRLYQKDLVGATEGNISVRLSEKEILTTPTGVCKGYMTPDMLVKVNLKGDIISGKQKPSSELKMHLRVYEERDDVRAVVHAHPPYATAFAIAGHELNMAYMPEVVVLLGSVPVAEYGTPSTHEVPESIAKYVKQHHALLLENHGALTWGNELFQTLYRMEMLEFYAKISYLTKQIGFERELSKDRVNQLLVLREQMGIRGNTPQGIDCEQGQNACSIDTKAETKYSQSAAISRPQKSDPPGVNQQLYQQLLKGSNPSQHVTSIKNSSPPQQKNSIKDSSSSQQINSIQNSSHSKGIENDELQEIIKQVTLAVLKQL